MVIGSSFRYRCAAVRMRWRSIWATLIFSVFAAKLRATADFETAADPNSAPTLAQKARLEILLICVPDSSVFELENPLHQEPLLSCLRLRKRLLKRPHQLLPLLHFGIVLVSLTFLLE